MGAISLLKKVDITMKKVIVTLMCTILLASCNSSESERTLRNIKATNVRVEKYDNNVSFPFISEPFRNSQLSFRVNGLLNNFETISGEFYRKGTVVAQLDTRDFAIQKERMESAFNQSEAEYNRIKALHSLNNISQSAYEKAEADYISAKTALEISTNEYKDTRLVAPFDGYISDIHVDNFQEVKASQPIVSFVDISKIKVEVYVTQQIAINTKKGDKVSIRFDMFNDKVYEAVVDEVSKNTAPNNLSYKLTALIPNSNKELIAGMVGTLSIDNEIQSKEIMTVPIVALCHTEADGDYIWKIVDGNRVSKTNVTIGSVLPDGQVEILSGITENDKIAISSLNFLSDEMEVKVCN